MSCGRGIPGRLGRLHPDGCRFLFPELRDLPDKYLWGSLWATEESARQANALNEANHDHRTYGPIKTDIGFATASDLRPAMVEAEARAARLREALENLRGQPHAWF